MAIALVVVFYVNMVILVTSVKLSKMVEKQNDLRHSTLEFADHGSSKDSNKGNMQAICHANHLSTKTKEIKWAFQTEASPIDQKQVQAGETQGAYPAIFISNHNLNSYSRGKLPEFLLWLGKIQVPVKGFMAWASSVWHPTMAHCIGELKMMEKLIHGSVLILLWFQEVPKASYSVWALGTRSKRLDPRIRWHCMYYWQ